MEKKLQLLLFKATVVWPALANPPQFIANSISLEAQRSIFYATFKLSNYEPLAFDGVEPNLIEIWSIKVLLELCI